MQEKLQTLHDTMLSAQELANSQELLALPSLNDARKLIAKAMFAIGNYNRTAQTSSNEQQPHYTEEELDETTIKIREAQKYIVRQSDGSNKIGNKSFRGDVPQKPLLDYYEAHLSAAAIAKKAAKLQPDAQEQQPESVETMVMVAIPTTDRPSVAVANEADYLEKKNLLETASEGSRTAPWYLQMVEAVKAYELVTGADMPKALTRRQEMELLLPALEITDAQIVEINEYAKTVGSDSIKKKYSGDQINAVLIVLHGADKIDSANGAARKLHAIHHPEKA
jgi:hypothetical protein